MFEAVKNKYLIDNNSHFKLVDALTVEDKSLIDKKISPHILRRTCAMQTLQATKDIRKVALWLGHASTQTTEAYLRMDPSEKLELMESMLPPSVSKGHFKVTDKVLQMINPKSH